MAREFSPFVESLSPRQWGLFCDMGMSEPLPLAEADLARPFVYERKHGVFYVPGGMHPGAMSFLLALQHGAPTGVDVARVLGLRYSGGTADHWLEHTPGAAFRSSVGNHIQIATGRDLTVLERRLFANAQHVF